MSLIILSLFIVFCSFVTSFLNFLLGEKDFRFRLRDASFTVVICCWTKGLVISHFLLILTSSCCLYHWLFIRAVRWSSLFPVWCDFSTKSSDTAWSWGCTSKLWGQYSWSVILQFSLLKMYGDDFGIQGSWNDIDYSGTETIR